MITSIEGRIAERGDDYVVVVVNGIGYQVFVPHSTKQKLSDERSFLHTTLIVREDSLTLYGFATTTEREIFHQLIGISGVGPRLALAILSTLSPDNLKMAVIQERAELLTRVPGIGKKTAQKIVFELKDKFPTGLDAIPIEAFEDDINTDVIDTLLALGYSVVEAQAAVQSLPVDAPENVEERVRLALQYFA